MLIYHIILPQDLDEVSKGDSYAAASLADEGFIHCSFERQLAGVIERYYADQKKLVVITIDTERLTSPLVVEPSTNDEEYPHIFGEINREAMIKFTEIDNTDAPTF